MASITNSSIRANNRKKIVHILFKEGDMTKLELSQRLDISVPTVTTVLNGLMDLGLVCVGQVLSSTGGRKAASYSPVLGARYALGADASEQGLHIALLDLGGNIIAKEYYPVMRDNTSAYWTRVDQILKDFVSKNVKDTGSLLDTGITLEIPMEEGRAILRPGSEPVDLELAQNCLSHKVTFRNSTKMAALAQIWNQNDSGSFIFVKLGNTVNSSAVYRGESLDFSLVNGAVGSFVIPGTGGQTLGERMSARSLALQAGVSGIDEFFRLLDLNETEARRIWEDYLEELAILLHNINCLYSWKIVIGGALSPRIRQSEAELRGKLDCHAVHFAGDPVRFEFSELGEYAAGVGAAMLPIDHFLSSIE